MRGFNVDDVAGHKPVKEHAQRGQVLLDGRRRQLVLEILDESCDMKRLDALKRIDVFYPRTSPQNGERRGVAQRGGEALSESRARRR